MEIKETTFNTRQSIAIAGRNDALPMKEVPTGTVVRYKGHIIQAAQKNNKETGEIERFDALLLVAEDGKIYATRSEIFIRTFKEILEELKDDPEPIDIEILHEKSMKTGNIFATCSLHFEW